MLAAPDLETRRGAGQGTPKSQGKNHTADLKSDVLEFQAGKLRRLYFLAHDISRTIAHLAFGVCR
jgi:hypothetical protein